MRSCPRCVHFAPDTRPWQSIALTWGVLSCTHCHHTCMHRCTRCVPYTRRAVPVPNAGAVLDHMHRWLAKPPRKEIAFKTERELHKLRRRVERSRLAEARRAEAERLARRPREPWDLIGRVRRFADEVPAEEPATTTARHTSTANGEARHTSTANGEARHTSTANGEARESSPRPMHAPRGAWRWRRAVTTNHSNQPREQGDSPSLAESDQHIKGAAVACASSSCGSWGEGSGVLRRADLRLSARPHLYTAHSARPPYKPHSERSCMSSDAQLSASQTPLLPSGLASSQGSPSLHASHFATLTGSSASRSSRRSLCTTPMHLPPGRIDWSMADDPLNLWAAALCSRASTAGHLPHLGTELPYMSCGTRLFDPSNLSRPRTENASVRDYAIITSSHSKALHHAACSLPCTPRPSLLMKRRPRAHLKSL